MHFPHIRRLKAIMSGIKQNSFIGVMMVFFNNKTLIIIIYHNFKTVWVTLNISIDLKTHSYCAIQDKITLCNWCKFSIKIIRNDAETAPSKGAIWEELSQQHQYQNIKKIIIFDDQLALFWSKEDEHVVYILVGIYL